MHLNRVAVAEFFKRMPRAPSWSAVSSSDFSISAVRRIVRTVGARVRNSRSASRQCIPGIDTPINRTSLATSDARRTTCGPSLASPTMVKPASLSNSLRNPSRNNPCASAMITRMRVVVSTSASRNHRVSLSVRRIASQAAQAQHRAAARSTPSTHVPIPLEHDAPALIRQQRVAKSLRVGTRSRVQATVSVVNLLNASSTLGWNTQYGPNWLTPSLILQGRLVKFGAQVDF